MIKTTDLYIDIMGRDYFAEVLYEYTEACRGSRNEYGVPMEPDWPESVDVLKVTINEGDEKIIIDLPSVAMTDIADKILEDNYEL